MTQATPSLPPVPVATEDEITKAKQAGYMTRQDDNGLWYMDLESDPFAALWSGGHSTEADMWSVIVDHAKQTGRIAQ